MKNTGVKIIASLLATAAVVVGVSSLVGGEERKPVPFTEVHRLPERKAAVSAEELWAETLKAAECFDNHGIRTVGPYPSADGTYVELMASIQRNSEADKACNTPLMPLQMRYGMDDSKAEADKLIALRSDLEACLLQRGVKLSQMPTEGVDPSTVNRNGPLQAATMNNPEATRACAESLTP